MIEILLATIRPKDLLAGKVLGLGLLGLGQLLIVAAASGWWWPRATGALDVDGDLIVAIALSLGWFVLGYAFYASAYAVAGALVPRQEEIQSSTTPLTMLILISLFVGFAVNDDPDGTLAHVTAFIPPVAPVTMPVADHPRRRARVGDRRVGGADADRDADADPVRRPDLRAPSCCAPARRSSCARRSRLARAQK